ncbi:uncharacterized protein GGS25DRAFT_111211 [Hypoxylon fragiforme]|uniref:uncharacterized protein n=1 Tax=Hypoxylon fragiforme TaxID=63214 RepID=UPI0020C5FDE5|nr:uncharacterized protein GGS25DRAFT_111211 [Hypoxylon fragiforme]KAI2612228.1 hypothetical protein GGS25DRAFT_111211 [Hypoxylon fragiforme]
MYALHVCHVCVCVCVCVCMYGQSRTLNHSTGLCRTSLDIWISGYVSPNEGQRQGFGPFHTVPLLFPCAPLDRYDVVFTMYLGIKMQIASGGLPELGLVF